MIQQYKCACCGKAGISTSTRERRFCSKKCSNQYYSEQRYQACKHNAEVICGTDNCGACGWNPVVAKRRLEARA